MKLPKIFNKEIYSNEKIIIDLSADFRIKNKIFMKLYNVKHIFT